MSPAALNVVRREAHSADQLPVADTPQISKWLWQSDYKVLRQDHICTQASGGDFVYEPESTVLPVATSVASCAGKSLESSRNPFNPCCVNRTDRIPAMMPRSTMPSDSGILSVFRSLTVLACMLMWTGASKDKSARTFQHRDHPCPGAGRTGVRRTCLPPYARLTSCRIRPIDIAPSF